MPVPLRRLGTPVPGRQSHPAAPRHLPDLLFSHLRLLAGTHSNRQGRRLLQDSLCPHSTARHQGG